MEEKLYHSVFESPIGPLHLGVNRRGVVLHIGFSDGFLAQSEHPVEENKWACGELAFQLDEYFRGKRTEFTLETSAQGTPFQQSVWHRLRKIAYGSTMTYGEIAQKIGRRGAARPVGNAAAANPILILVPCHRVLPARGGIGQYAADSLDKQRGREKKSLLLKLEGILE